jgi:DeoR family suf operon transcriptional repressor
MVHQSHGSSPLNDSTSGDRDYTREGFQFRRRTLLSALPRTERDIVLALKLHGPTNIVQLSERLRASTSSLRPHLGQLESDGIVRHHTRVKGPGRPQYLFSLTEEGQELFPTAVSQFGVSLVRFLARRNPDLLKEFAVEAQSRYLQDAAGELSGLDYDDLMQALTAALSAGDYMPEPKPDDDENVAVTLHHCPLAAIAAEFPAICDFEQASLQEMAHGTEVKRTLYRFDGDPVCVYHFRRLRAGELAPPIPFPRGGAAQDLPLAKPLVF